MLLTLTTTRAPATDLGHLLHKNPGKVQTFQLSFGKAHGTDDCPREPTGLSPS